MSYSIHNTLAKFLLHQLIYYICMAGLKWAKNSIKWPSFLRLDFCDEIIAVSMLQYMRCVTQILLWCKILIETFFKR